MVVAAQAPEVVEGYHLQVWSLKSVGQLLTDGVEDAHPRLPLHALVKSFFLASGLFLRRRLVASHAIGNLAFLGLAEIEDAASTLAVNENSGLGVGALPFGFGLPVLPFKEHVFGMAVCLPWVSIILLTPALCFHVFSRADAANSYWRAFWTFSYLAFLTHIYWTIFVTFRLNWAEIFHSQAGIAIDPERVVEHPGPDLFLAAWWGLDVLLAWLVADYKWVRVQRGGVHLLAFIMFFGAFTLAAKASMVAHILGIVTLMTVASCFLLSFIIRESDPKSLISHDSLLPNLALYRARY